MTHGTGEEWRALDAGTEAFASPASLAVVASARESIRRIRMRAVELRLVDRRGQPLAGVAVAVRQLRNAFCVGDQLWTLDRLYRYGQGATDTALARQRRFADVFNAATALCYWTERPVNDGPKMEEQQGEPRLESFAACVDWAAGQGLTVKGHPLCWSIPKAVPEWVQRYDYPTQLKFLEVRIRTLVARFRGRVRIWDAVNEALWEPAFANLARRQWPHLEEIEAIADYIAPVLAWARDEDPDACYLVNDYGLEADSPHGLPVTAAGHPVTAAGQRQRLRHLLDALAARGARPNAIGLQSHTGGWIGHDTQVAVYEELAAASLPLHITEFWADRDKLAPGTYSPDEQAQLHADYVANYLTVAYGHPAVEAFFFWGFLDDAIRWGEHSSHTLTPTYTRIRQLLREEWLTRESLVSDQDGVVRFHGHFGDYTLRYPLSEAQISGVPFRVDRQATMPVTVELPLMEG